MADHGWGSAAPADAGDAAGGAFNTGDMQAALPAQDANGIKTAPGWVPATPYDYKAYGKDGEHEWESNAAVYEWDGDTGDIGPEFPALEVELFGEPGERTGHGIDFSK